MMAYIKKRQILMKYMFWHVTVSDTSTCTNCNGVPSSKFTFSIKISMAISAHSNGLATSWAIGTPRLPNHLYLSPSFLSRLLWTW